MIKKLIVITLLIFLVRMPVYGHEMNYDTYKASDYKESDYCDRNPEYYKWEEKKRKFRTKKNVHYSKCILKHSKNESSISEDEITSACSFLAKDKYGIAEVPSPWADRNTGKETYYTNCHPHE